MNKLIIDRREFLKLELSSGVLPILLFGYVEASDDEFGEFLKVVSDSSLPVNYWRTGKLSDADFNTLASLCEYVSTDWELSLNLNEYLVRLRSDLEFK